MSALASNSYGPTEKLSSPARKTNHATRRYTRGLLQRLVSPSWYFKENDDGRENERQRDH